MRDDILFGLLVGVVTVWALWPTPPEHGYPVSDLVQMDKLVVDVLEGSQP